MAVSDAHKRASYKWEQLTGQYNDTTKQRRGQQIRDAAAKAGQSVQAYVLDAVRERMKDNSRGE